MADFLFNVSKGRFVEFAHRVENNDPTNAALIILAINTSATDATLKDLDTLAAVLADGNTAEVTNTNYARKTLANGSLTITTDDTGDEQEVDFADQTFTSIEAGDSWTDLIVAYDSDTTTGTDTNIIPISQHDATTTPDGNNIVIQIDPEGFAKAS